MAIWGQFVRPCDELHGESWVFASASMTHALHNRQLRASFNGHMVSLGVQHLELKLPVYARYANIVDSAEADARLPSACQLQGS